THQTLRQNTVLSFFFQAEDGIRDFHVTGVQTCALPISLTSLGETLNEQQVQDLTLEVRTIFAHNCNNCHGEAKKKGGLRLDSREAIFAGGESGPILVPDRKSTRLNSSHVKISYAVFCLKKKN